jgi:hypothetical protein
MKLSLKEIQELKDLELKAYVEFADQLSSEYARHANEKHREFGCSAKCAEAWMHFYQDQICALHERLLILSLKEEAD